MTIPPALVMGVARLVFGGYASGLGNSNLWGSAVFGGLIAAGAVYRHKRMPLWLAAAIGVLLVLLPMVAPSVWALWLR